MSVQPVVALFATTLFASSFLMFLIEPMVAKMVLPILGGAPMVWNTCVVFFQIMLLAGYAFAHGATSWLGPRRYAVVYAALLVIPLATLPVTIRAAAAPPLTGNPIAWLLPVLVSSIGLPFFVLSTSASVLQKLFSGTAHPAAQDPYFLYTASNLGSLLALVSYPAFVEPSLRLPDQSRLWTIGYAMFAALAFICAVIAWRWARASREDWLTQIEDPSTGPIASIPPSWSRRARWMVLSFIPSSLMLAVTSYLSTDIAAVPLLWILPLSLYLLTFVLAFGSRSGYFRAVADRGLPLLILPLALLMAAQAQPTIWFAIPLNLLTFAMAALLCHGELANDRPSPVSLTEFYFWIGCGGVLGGLFNTLAAPVLFTGIAEYSFVLVLACLVRPRAPSVMTTTTPRYLLRELIMPVAVGALTAGLIVSTRRLADNPSLVLAALGLPAIVSFRRSRRPVPFALSVGAMLLAGAWVGNGYGRVLHTERTFFGVYRVSMDPSGRYHALFHGTTLHGMQAVAETRQGEPLTYYHRTGPFGQAFEQLPHLSNAPEIAVVGLGVGSLASYAAPNQRWIFYEIDPAVERIARNPEYFTFLRHCGNRCSVVLGDARLSLARARPNEYGLIVLDAFSSDAIPMHLVTSEAISLYLTRLAPGGVLAFHISNAHLSLGPVLARAALGHGLTALEQQQRVNEADATDGKSHSEWLIMARDRRDLGSLVGDTRWVTPAVSMSAPLWTDDFSNILSVLSLRH